MLLGVESTIHVHGSCILYSSSIQPIFSELTQCATDATARSLIADVRHEVDK